MKKLWVHGLFCLMLLTVFMCLAVPVFGADKTYNIEVLQVTRSSALDLTYDGFIDELGKNGIRRGQNLNINRTIIDFDISDAGLWKKIGVLRKIKSEASRIADCRPDLVLTIGTPATKYGKDKIIKKGIPLVFSAVAIPEAAGCKSMTEAGEGFTGATLYMDAENAFKLIKFAFPNMKTVGMIYSDDDNGVAQTEEAIAKAPRVGIQVIAKQVNKTDPIEPAAEELISRGAQAFAVPLDTYYGLDNSRRAKDLAKISLEKRIPNISLIKENNVPGGIMYIGSDFTTIGGYSAQQAVKILKENIAPGSIPIMRQNDLGILVDIKRMQELNIQLPLEILQIAEAVK